MITQEMRNRGITCKTKQHCGICNFKDKCVDSSFHHHDIPKTTPGTYNQTQFTNTNIKKHGVDKGLLKMTSYPCGVVTVREVTSHQYDMIMDILKNNK